MDFLHQNKMSEDYRDKKNLKNKNEDFNFSDCDIVIAGGKK